MSVFAIVIPQLTAVVAAPPAEKKARVRIVNAKLSQPSVVGKGRGFVVHAIPWNFDRGWILAELRQDFIITHTALPVGKMTVLARSGETRTFSPPMGIDRVTYRKTELIGVAVKHEHIAVLTRISVAGGMRSRKTKKFATYGKPSHYQLTLYSTRDGKQRSTLAIDRKLARDAVCLITIGAGPLTIKKDRVLLWKRTVLIDAKGGMRLLKDAEK